MELQQLEKRIDWLDDERRKDKNTITQLKERVIVLEGKLRTTNQENKDIQGEVTRLTAGIGRMDRIDDTIIKTRAELQKSIKQQSKQIDQREEAVKNLLNIEVSGFGEILKKTKDTINASIQDVVQAREQEDVRLSGSINALAQTVDEMRVNVEDQGHSHRVVEDGRRRDAQRLTDLQGEVSALRKRSDEYRGQFDILGAETRRIESRLNELLSVERERSDAQKAFFEKQSSAEVEREKTWKKWAARFNTIEKQTMEIDAYLKSMGDTHLDIKRAQETVEELVQKVERRINELTEMHRLSEERFRQEWNTFKADDQKRWTNYMLSYDEQQSEVTRRFEHLTERATYIEDNLQEIHDFLQEVNEFTWKRLHEILEAFRDWTADQERVQGQLG
ncbi:MAG: hypothetical protein U9Q82_08465 [Chloroflexota bacterium]|nr:hypothetical protein [Chloroflexota bacterium]